LPGLEKNHISAARQNFKNPLGNFFGINMRSPYAKFQLSGFKTQGGVCIDGCTDDTFSPLLTYMGACNIIKLLSGCQVPALPLIKRILETKRFQNGLRTYLECEARPVQNLVKFGLLVDV